MKIIQQTLLLLVFFTSLTITGQQQCKVLKADIASEYSGGCKNGLAHGEGIAKGENIYEGNFKKGLPNGVGTMVYTDGSIYIGSWKNGVKQGKGKYSYMLDAKDSIQEGIWKKGKFVGKKEVKKYKVIKKDGVPRYVIRKVGNEFNRVTIRVKNSGTIHNISANNITGTSGNTFNYQGYVGFENINTFPFTCEMRYRMTTKLGTTSFLVEFVFKLNEPGDWLVEIYH